jgi:uncharacterized membrane protein
VNVKFQSGSVPNDPDIHLLHVYSDIWILFSRRQRHQEENSENGIADVLALGSKEIHMLGIIAAVLIVLWLLGFFAFHVTTGFIHIVLVVGLVLLVFHFLRGRSAVA